LVYKTEFKLLYCAAPVGSTPALSKTALCTWLDNLITGIAKEDPKIYNNSGIREDGTYHLLKQTEFGKIIRLLTNLHQWTAECNAVPVSCGSFYMVIPGGRGGITKEQITCGPFI